MFNPLDVSKDVYDNVIVNGLKYNIRNSEMQKERIQTFIQNNIFTFETYGMSRQEILQLALEKLNIKLDELTVADEHELLDWIYRFM